MSFRELKVIAEITKIRIHATGLLLMTNSEPMEATIKILVILI